MFALFSVLIVLAATVSAHPAVDITIDGAAEPAPNELHARAESHNVNIVNRCGSGQGKFLYRDNGTPQGSTTINGPIYGGIAWMDGYKNCLASGVNCGVVEFTLINQGTDPANAHNSVDYSLLTQGNHQFQYAMNFAYNGGGACSGLGAPGACTSASDCPGAYTGSNTASGKPVTCAGDNAGITITFC